MHKIYFISGLGTKCSIFDKINIGINYEKIYIEWIVPTKNENLNSYVTKISEQIKENDFEFSLVGVSFGGIVAQEISKIKKPKNLILISSVTNKYEFKKILNIFKKIKVYSILPKFFFNKKTLFFFFIIRKLVSNKNIKIKEYILNIDSYYFIWSIKQVLNWNRNFKIDSKVNIYRIHGTKDPLFIANDTTGKDCIIQNGNHIVILQKQNIIQKFFNNIFYIKTSKLA